MDERQKFVRAVEGGEPIRSFLERMRAILELVFGVQGKAACGNDAGKLLADLGSLQAARRRKERFVVTVGCRPAGSASRR